MTTYSIRVTPTTGFGFGAKPPSQVLVHNATSVNIRPTMVTQWGFGAKPPHLVVTGAAPGVQNPFAVTPTTIWGFGLTSATLSLAGLVVQVNPNTTFGFFGGPSSYSLPAAEVEGRVYRYDPVSQVWKGTYLQVYKAGAWERAYVTYWNGVAWVRTPVPQGAS